MRYLLRVSRNGEYCLEPIEGSGELAIVHSVHKKPPEFWTVLNRLKAVHLYIITVIEQDYDKMRREFVRLLDIDIKYIDLLVKHHKRLAKRLYKKLLQAPDNIKDNFCETKYILLVDYLKRALWG